MAPMHIVVREIKKNKTSAAMKLRVVRTYDVLQSRGNEEIKSRECVFHDHENKFIEGNVYCIKNFMAVQHYYSYKTCSGPHMLKLFNETLVKDYKGLDFPTHMYRLPSFTSLNTVDPTVLVDVIGRVVEIHSPLDKLISGRPSRLIDFLIEGLNGNQLKCTVWDQHVEKLMPFFRKDFVEPIIVLIQMGRPVIVLTNAYLKSPVSVAVKVAETLTYYDVAAKVKITSSYDATQLLFNGDSTEFLEFREILSLQQTPLKSITSNSTYSYGNSSSGDLSSSKMHIITISDIFEKREIGDFWVPAQIIGIESDVNDWFYESCKAQGCNKKGTAPFLLWDREALDLLSVKADEVIAMQPKVMTKIPKELKTMVGKGLFFKIDILKDQLDNLSFFPEEEAKSLNVNAVKEASVPVTENEAVKRSLLDQFSSTQTSRKKKHVVVKEEKELEDKET
ncbi:uncharacterized protein LOC116020232 [Ipomoea triloba]|uniref:uncharacterized protein LOC116020232 n=1 Tax=Ipomoea triloba TaxID=35885 RepID=UPI00125E70F3|nr:uncharacterized protein LOC116020232 [Ipomoea triloba]